MGKSLTHRQTHRATGEGKQEEELSDARKRKNGEASTGGAETDERRLVTARTKARQRLNLAEQVNCRLARLPPRADALTHSRLGPSSP